MKQAGADATILSKINLRPNPTISTEQYKTLTDHNVAWSIYFEEISENKWEFIKDDSTLQSMQESIYIINQVKQQKITNTNLLVPSTMYEQGLGTECFVVVEGFYKYKNDQGQDVETIYW
jgi:hypothetical protein